MKYRIMRILSVIFKIFWVFPLDEKKVIFRSSEGNKYNCNPKYISEYCMRHHSAEFKVLWLFNDTKKYSYLKETGIQIYKNNSIRSIYHLCTAKFIIDNHGVQSYLPVRKGQVIINTWHGGGSYKKNKKNLTKNKAAYLKIMKQNTSFYISSCDKFSKCNLSDVYSENPEKILPYGMARNDIFFGNFQDVMNKVKEYYNIPEKKGIILYAPTYRTYNYVDGLMKFEIDVESVRNACKTRFNKDFVFAYRLHAFVEDECGGIQKNCLYVNDYEDMQELIAASDVIITDYSSLIWDAAIAKKPCFIFATDLEQYMNDRDFYTPIREWPFPLAQTNKELERNILYFNDETYLSEISSHLSSMHSFENGNSAKKTVEFMESMVNRKN